MKALRILTSLIILGVGILFVVYGQSEKLRDMPLPVAGYMFIVTGVLGLLGVNVFWGGPLDKRRDWDAILRDAQKRSMRDGQDSQFD